MWQPPIGQRGSTGQLTRLNFSVVVRLWVPEGHELMQGDGVMPHKLLSLKSLCSQWKRESISYGFASSLFGKTLQDSRLRNVSSRSARELTVCIRRVYGVYRERLR
jgi:hypothetical protein